ncbi:MULTISPECIES: K(+)-transporting ATPase subunit C [unclassified Synechocystis]|uniref:K(+)-transporting ATPase subunit C n=1 Tax=unclassified Synechocystis TaxID=2640012 RepID=UPI0003FB4955|nr:MULTISPECIES: K(+)-transporting ATPase subunit C [unclassified Synechocystis]AIE74239.1 Potassium-transporting ATPase C chain [Synechocystis sp. PCC 6714]MCT0252867.1 K(+)-transporting ATPase subunit C [Synechocystis sp. CS-94]
MSQVREFSKAVRATILLWIITAIFYPLLVWVIGQLIFPFQANGSMLKNDQGTIVASALIGQPFNGDRYFWSRPSMVDYSTGSMAGITGISGASNLAPGSFLLKERIDHNLKKLQEADIKPTADLVYSSGSGLDPHISLEAAKNQINRIVQARKINPSQVELLITQATEGRFLGIFGEPGVNVVKLNLALDQIDSLAPQ